MKKFFNLFIGFIFFIFLIFLVLHFNESKLLIIDNINIWIKYIIVSVTPTFIISNFLFKYPFISYLFYPVLKKIMHFENQKACSLFLISILCGNPSTVILINNAYYNKEISLFEANRLLCFTSHPSFLFIINFFKIKKGLIIIMIQVISSIIISFFLKNKNLSNTKTNNSIRTNNNIFIDIINKTPNLLFNILFIIIITSHIKWFLNLITNNNYYLNILFNYMELTTGLVDLQNNFLLSNLLISFNGIAIILQVFINIKKTDLSFDQFLKFRLIHMLICLIILLFVINFLM